MSDMKGNPHYADASKNRSQLIQEHTSNEDYLAEQGITDATMQFGALNRIAESTLALAYEQRTANLIAYHALWNQIEDAQPTEESDNEIARRLGISDD